MYRSYSRAFLVRRSVCSLGTGTARRSVSSSTVGYIGAACANSGKTTSFTGIEGISEQDAAIQDSQGYIVDRTREHLGPTDLGVVRFRRAILDAVRGLRQGIEPPAASRPEAYRVRSGGAIAPDDGDVADMLIERFGNTTGRIDDAADELEPVPPG